MHLKCLTSLNMTSDTILHVLYEKTFLNLYLKIFVCLFLKPHPLLFDILESLVPHLLI
jgi:hypothetical protein